MVSIQSSLSARTTSAVLCVIALPMITSDARAQSVTFKPRVDFGVAQPNVVQSSLADFNHDGNLDIAVTMEGESAGKVEVLFGDGHSDFGTTTEFLAYVAWGLCTADLNGDGWNDIAVTAKAWASHGVGVVFNNHTGGFAGGSSMSTLASPPVALAAGDFDGDGIMDLAAASESGGYAVDWFKGLGSGAFSGFHYVPITSNLVGSRIYTGHFNADTPLDLVLTHSTGVMVLLNDTSAAGNFAAASGITISENIQSLAVLDIDGDGLDDLLTGSYSGNLRVWRCLGNGSFTLLHSYTSTVGALEVALGDLNKDGNQDVMLVGLSGVQLFFGLGGGAFSAPQTIAAGVYPKTGVIGDWNGDGWLDIAIACKNLAGMDSYVSVYEQLPTGTAFCFGDGTGTACPCGNVGAAGRGCANSIGTGALLAPSGSQLVSNDTVVLTGTGMPNSSVLYFQGTTQQSAGSGAVFGDGLRCAAGSVIRLGTKVNTGGASQYPVGADPKISIKGLVAAGNVRTYQCWYRNAAAFCNAETFNLTNGIQITWAP